MPPFSLIAQILFTIPPFSMCLSLVIAQLCAECPLIFLNASFPFVSRSLSPEGCVRRDGKPRQHHRTRNSTTLRADAQGEWIAASEGGGGEGKGGPGSSFVFNLTFQSYFFFLFFIPFFFYLSVSFPMFSFFQVFYLCLWKFLFFSPSPLGLQGVLWPFSLSVCVFDYLSIFSSKFHLHHEVYLVKIIFEIY